jgi:formate/nitrite transporter FocA (FNT family)
LVFADLPIVAGEEKAKFQWYKMLMLTVIAGCYVGFGYTLCLQVGGTP